MRGSSRRPHRGQQHRHYNYSLLSPVRSGRSSACPLLYVFLREIRHELFDTSFEAALAKAYKKPRGTAPLPPALLAMVILLQAYDHVGDADAVVTASMDKRWPLVLGTLGAEEAPFSQDALVAFRERLIAHDLDRKLVSRTVL
jgi:hypothetical protein